MASPLVELRYTPEAGGGNQRWRDLAESMNDCHAVVVSGIGRAPRWALERAGLRVIEMSGLISEGLGSLFRTGEVPAVDEETIQILRIGVSGYRHGLRLTSDRRRGTWKNQNIISLYAPASGSRARPRACVIARNPLVVAVSTERAL